MQLIFSLNAIRVWKVMEMDIWHIRVENNWKLTPSPPPNPLNPLLFTAIIRKFLERNVKND